jgi:hypothetical protein
MNKKDSKLILIDIDCSGDVLHKNLALELPRILNTAIQGLILQLDLDGRCICEAKEFTNDLRDISGTTVGHISLSDNRECKG